MVIIRVLMNFDVIIFQKNTPLGFDELKNNRDETSDGPTSPKQLYHMTKGKTA